MNMIRLSLRMLLRDWRAGELHILTLALIIAVSSVATVSFFQIGYREHWCWKVTGYWGEIYW